MGRGDGHNRASQAKNLLYGPRPAGPGPSEIEEEVVEEAPKNLSSVPESVAESRAALPLDKMRARGVEQAIIYYTGYGDSGDVDFITTKPEDKKITEDDEEKALVDFAFNLLEARHGGWEINEGSNGTITIDLEKGTIEHDHYTNYIAQDRDLDEMSLD